MKGRSHPWRNSVLQMVEGSDFHQGWKHGREEFFSRLDAGMIEHTIRLLDEELLALICRNNGTRWYFTLDAQDDAAAYVGYLIGYLSGPLAPETPTERAERRQGEHHEQGEHREQDETGQLTRMLPHGSGVIRIIEPPSTRAAIYARTQGERDICSGYCEQKGYTLKEEHCYQGEGPLLDSSSSHAFRRAANNHAFDVLVIFDEQCLCAYPKRLSALKTVLQNWRVRIETIKEATE